MGLLKRYLVYFSYIGTYFRGAQRQVPRNLENNQDPHTVQGLLEIAFKRMKPNNEPIVILSSRTDQGVHAIKSAASVDLQFNKDYKPINMHHFMNRFFSDTDVPIRVQDIFQVPWEFNSRKLPLWRKYIYRFAILKPGHLNENKSTKYTLPLPITEYNRCYFVLDSKFDIAAVRKTCELFVGTKNFISFMGKPQNQPEDISTIRCMHSVIVEPAQPTVPTPYNDCFDYYHLICEGKSFLYNQVRRTVTVLLAVGQGRVTYVDVEEMFTDPSPSSYPSTLNLAPAHGLYLTDIFYDPKDLELPNDIKDEIEEPEDLIEIAKRKKEIIKERLEVLRLKKAKYSGKLY